MARYHKRAHFKTNTKLRELPLIFDSFFCRRDNLPGKISKLVQARQVALTWKVNCWLSIGRILKTLRRPLHWYYSCDSCYQGPSNSHLGWRLRSIIIMAPPIQKTWVACNYSRISRMEVLRSARLTLLSTGSQEVKPIFKQQFVHCKIVVKAVMSCNTRQTLQRVRNDQNWFRALKNLLKMEREDTWKMMENLYKESTAVYHENIYALLFNKQC